ncbi:FecR domain-containing protein, partial [Pseudanabaenaceae cyanobacterium LEGE 13415]|nr:FecR domain-containing protein [Pseudanabaenaceae cyanobacterium LEGE 13415]
MSRNWFLAIPSLALGVSAVLLASAAHALTPITSAEIREIVRQVRFVPRGQAERDAILSEIMRPDDALKTSRASRVGLRFNDGSWARVGEMAVFRFIPGTRNFRLNNGTVLLLIKPGQGRTTIDTPNASAGVRGSALFVRYDEQTETTVIGALTNNPNGPMEIVDNTTGRKLPLEAGQMAIVDPLGIRLFNFDMHRFYETSDMVRGLDLQRREAQPSAEPGIAAVQAETAQALREQKPLSGPVIENPRMVQLSPAETPVATPIQNPGTTTQQTTTAETKPDTGTGTTTGTPPSGSTPSSTTPNTTTSSGSGDSSTPGGSSTTPRQVNDRNDVRGASQTDPTGNTGTTTNPGNSTNTPGNSTNAPGNSTNTPGNSTSTPGNSTSTPGNSTNTPGNSTNTPGNSTNTPGNSTPSGTTSTPPGSTTPTGGAAPSTPNTTPPPNSPSSTPPTSTSPSAPINNSGSPIEVTPTPGSSTAPGTIVAPSPNPNPTTNTPLNPTVT